MQDKGSVLAILTCQQKIVTLASNETECYEHIKVYNSQFVDRKTCILRNFSSTRHYSPKLPLNIIRTTDNQYIAFKPYPLQVGVKKNVTAIGDLTINMNETEEISYLNEDDGFATNSEWSHFQNILNYGHLKGALQESFVTSLCSDNEQCGSFLNSRNFDRKFNTSKLNLPTVE